MNEEIDEIDFKQKINGNIWLKLLRYVMPFKKTIIIGLIGISLTALVETLFVSFVSNEGLEKYANQPIDGNFWLFIAGMVGLVLTEAILVKIFVSAFARVEYKTYDKMTTHIFTHLQELSYSFYDKYSVGWLLSRTTSDTSRLSETISWGISDIIWSVFKLIFILVMMLSYSPKLTLIMIIVVPTIMTIGIFFRRIIMRYTWKVRKINSKVSGSLNEGISGAKTSKSLVLEEKNNKAFSNLVNSFRTTSIKSSTLHSLYYQIIAVIAAFGIASMTYFGGIEFINDNISYGGLFMFISYTMMFFDPVLSIARMSNEMKQAQVSAERIFNILAINPEVQDREDVIEKYGDYSHPKKENWEPLVGDVEFDHVTFGYNSGNVIVLDDFSLKVKKGQSVALVGETGAGKSTIVNLLCRFYEPTQGTIKIDGHDYKDRSVGWLHAKLGYVMQTPHLFSGTVKDNIRYGNFNATEEEIIAASKAANSHDFIMKLDKGYDTEVGEGGNRLSQGQKQLISFARAIVADPSILVLDEATSSIDTETEVKIQGAIANLLKSRTSFVVAHRLSTITSSDIILVVRAGKVIEQGSHSELLALKGYYYKLYTNQFIEDKMNELMN